MADITENKVEEEQSPQVEEQGAEETKETEEEASEEQPQEEQPKEEQQAAESNGPDLIVFSKMRTFWMEPILNYLSDNSVKVAHMDLNDTFLTEDLITSKYVLIQEEDYRDKFNGFLKKLCDFCAQHGKQIIIYGTSEGVVQLTISLPGDVVAMVLERPADTKVLGKRLVDFLLGTTSATAHKRKTILAVDDAGFMLRTIKSWLEDTYEIRLANSAAKAMTMLTNPRPDLILLDYEMPVCSGGQFLAMLQAEEHTARIPVVFLTAKDDKETVTEVLKLRPAGYVLKTTTQAQLKVVIADVLAKVEAAKQ